MAAQPEKIDWRRANRFLTFSAVALSIIGLLLIFYSSLLVPLLVSALLSYLLIPLVNALERRRVRRGMASAAIILISIAILALAVARLIPVLYAQVLILLHLMPHALQAILDNWIPVIEGAVSDLGFKGNLNLRSYIANFDVFSGIEAQLRDGLLGLWVTGTALLGGAVNLLLIPLVTFFILKERSQLFTNLKRLVPVDLLEPTRLCMHKIDLTLRSVIKGQAMVAGILAVLYVIGLSSVGLQSAIAIGVVAGICRIVPYLDVIVGGVLSTIVLLSNFAGFGQVLGVFFVFLIVQAVDGALITPRVVGDRAGLHPAVVIVSVLAFANWFGFWGVLLAIPTVAILKVLIETLIPYYQASKAYAPMPPADSAVEIIVGSPPVETNVAENQ